LPDPLFTAAHASTRASIGAAAARSDDRLLDIR
jgi:hypothetical protein